MQSEQLFEREFVVAGPPCQILANEANVPRLWPISGDALLLRRIAERKAKVCGMGSQPLDCCAGRNPKIDHSPELMLAVSGTCRSPDLLHRRENPHLIFIGAVCRFDLQRMPLAPRFPQKILQRLSHITNHAMPPFLIFLSTLVNTDQRCPRIVRAAWQTAGRIYPRELRHAIRK